MILKIKKLFKLKIFLEKMPSIQEISKNLEKINHLLIRLFQKNGRNIRKNFINLQ